MTKFEEEAIKEAKKCGYVMAHSKVVFYEDEKGITFINFNSEHTNFNFPWLEFAKNWHPDEEFQELLNKYCNLNDNYEKEVVRSSKLESQINELKSQLQQQALPVVPDFVAEWIEILKTKGLKPLKNPETYGETGFTEEKLQNILFWISGHQEDYMRAWLDGYTVEKPQLFYLKNKLTGAYLYYDEATKLYSDIVGNIEDFFGTKTKFTEAEIGSMETGSYEQIEVVE